MQSLNICGALAVSEEPTLLNIERIFPPNEFKEESADTIIWSKRGEYFFSIESPAANADLTPDDDGAGRDKQTGRVLLRQDPITGQETVLADSLDLTPPGANKPLAVSGFALSEDESRVLLFTNATQVWRRKTRGAYWVLDLASKRLRQLGGDDAGESLMFAKFSSDGTRVAYVHDNNLYVQDLADMKIRQLTHDGSTNIINGTADWVNEEELRLHDGFRWSPDGRHLLFWQFDVTGVERFTIVDQTTDHSQKFTTFPYPLAGGKNSAVRLGVIDVSGNANADIQWLKIPGDRREHYIPRADWTPDSKEVQFLQFNRLQNQLEVMRANIASGSVRVVITESDDAWVENRNEIRWIGTGDDFLWLSERSGWRHAYRVTAAGGVHPITKGEYDVIEIAGQDTQGGWLYFLASPDNPTQRYLFRVKVDGGPPERLTPADQAGTHAYDISKGTSLAVQTRSSITTPPVVELITLPEHRSVRVLKSQTALRKKLDSLALPDVEFFRIRIDDDREFDGWMVSPRGLDRTKKHPLLVHVYGEPASQTVRDHWGGSRMLWHWMLAQQGYVVASIDTRGTPSPRGREWRKAVYRRLGTLNADENAAAVGALLQRFRFLDPERVGVWGWSGGGTSALSAIFRYPGLYRTAIAVAPVSERALYNTIYEERYMGLPQNNEEGYRVGSPLFSANHLKGNLLIVHGTADDNVHYRSTERLINELVEHNKSFSVMPYPNRNHSINTGKGTSRHLYRLMTQFLHEHLPPNQAPAGTAPTDR